MSALRMLMYYSLGTKVIGYNPLGKIQQAAKNGEIWKLEKYFRQGYHVDDMDQKNRSLLHYACAYGRVQVVGFLVQNKCTIDLCDNDGNTPLMKALQYQEEECAIILLNNGANPNVQNHKGETPLHCAIFYKNTSLVTKLLSVNANIEGKNMRGQTPLLIAIKKNKRKMIEFFIENKANIHAVDDKGRTALMFAVEHKSTKITKLLLQCGINVSAADKCGRIALSYATASGNTENKTLIIKHMLAESKNSAIFTPVKESTTDDPLRRSTKKTDPVDSCVTVDEVTYPSHFKNAPKEGGDLTEASKKDEDYDKGKQKNGNLPEKSNTPSQKKDIVETPLVQSTTIRNDDCQLFSSHESKILSQNDVPGNEHQGAKPVVNGHTEDVVPMMSHMNESRNFKLNKPEDIVKEDTPMSGKGFQNFAHSFITPFLDRSYFVPKKKVRKTRASICKQAESLWDLSSEEDEKKDGRTTTDKPQGVSETPALRCVSHLSGDVSHTAEEGNDDLVKGVAPISSHASESRDLELVKSEDTGKEDAPVSHMVLQDSTQSSVKPIVDRSYFLPKTKLGKTEASISKSAESPWDTSSEEEEERLGATKTNHPQLCVSLISSHMGGSRDLKLVKSEDTGKEDTSVSHMEFLDSTQSFMKPILDRSYFLPKKKLGKTEASISTSAESPLDPSSEEDEKRLDGTKSNQLQGVSDTHLQMSASHSSGDVSHKGEKEEDGLIKGFQDDTQSFLKLILDRRYFLPKEKVGLTEASISKSAESPWDTSSDGEEERLDRTKTNQPQGVSETHPQMCVSHSSDDVYRRVEKDKDGQVKGVAPISSHVSESRDLELVKSEDTGKEDAPVSHMGFQDSSQSYVKPFLERTYFLPKKKGGKSEGSICKSAESPWDTSSEEEEERLGATKTNHPQGVSETHPQMCVSHLSGFVSHRIEKGEDGHVKGLAPISSHVGGSRDLEFVKSEDTGKEDAPVSHMGFQDSPQSLVKPVLDRRYFLPKKQLGMTEGSINKSAESPWDTSSEEKKEMLGEAKTNQPQGFSESNPHESSPPTSQDKHPRLKKEGDRHEDDTGPIYPHMRGSRDTRSVKREDTGKGDEEAEAVSHMASGDKSASAKKSYENHPHVSAPPTPRGKQPRVKRERDRHDDASGYKSASSKGFSESHPHVSAPRSPRDKHPRVKKEGDGLDNDIGPIRPHMRGLRDIKSIKQEDTEKEDEEVETVYHMASVDKSASAKGFSESHPHVSAPRSPQDKHPRVKKEGDGLDTDMGLICLHMGGSRDIKCVKGEDTGKGDEEAETVSNMATGDMSASAKVEVKRKKCAIQETKSSQNLHNYADNTDDDDVLIQRRKTRNADFPLFPKGKGQCDRPRMKTSKEKEKVKNQIDDMEDLDDLTYSPETISQDSELVCLNCNNILLTKTHGIPCKDSDSLLKPQKTGHLFEIIEDEESHCSQCLLYVKKNAELEYEIRELKVRLSEIKIVESELKQENTELKQQIHNLRCTLKEEELKRRNGLLHEKIKDQLKEKETEYNKEDKVRKQTEISVSTFDTELKIARNKFNEVTTSNGTENNLLQEYNRMKDKISIRNHGIDTIKYQKQEKRCQENTEIFTEKNDGLPRIHKLNEKTLKKTFQDNEQFDIWKVKNTVQNFTLENENQNTERLDTEVKSYSARPLAAPHHHDESQTPKKNLGLAFQRARNKDFISQGEKNIDVSNLKSSSEIPSPQVPKSEIKISEPENELFQIRDSPRVTYFSAGPVNSHLKQRKCQLRDRRCKYQIIQSKRSEHLRKQESSREKILSKTQNENTLLKDQLHDYHNKVEDKKDEFINIRDQFDGIIKIIQAQSDRYISDLKNSVMELVNENNYSKKHLEDRKDEAEEVTIKQDNCVAVRNREKQLDGTLKLQSVLHSSLEDTQHFHMDLEVKRQDLKKTRGQITSQMDDLTTNMDIPSSKHLHLEANYQFCTNNSFYFRSVENTLNKIERNQKNAREYMANLQRSIQSNRVEQGQGVQWKGDMEQQAR